MLRPIRNHVKYAFHPVALFCQPSPKVTPASLAELYGLTGSLPIVGDNRQKMINRIIGVGWQLVAGEGVNLSIVNRTN
jgi:hypothetical protein